MYFLVRETDANKVKTEDVSFVPNNKGPVVVFADNEQDLMSLGVKTPCDITPMYVRVSDLPSGYFPAEHPDRLNELEYLKKHEDIQLIADPTQMDGKFVFKRSWGVLSETMHYIIGTSADGMVVASAYLSAKGSGIKFHFLDESVKWYATEFQRTEQTTRQFVTGVTRTMFIMELQSHRPANSAMDDTIMESWIDKLCSAIPDATRDQWPKNRIDAAYNMINDYFAIMG